MVATRSQNAREAPNHNRITSTIGGAGEWSAPGTAEPT